MKKVVKYILMLLCYPAELANAVNIASNVKDMNRIVLEFHNGKACSKV